MQKSDSVSGEVTVPVQQNNSSLGPHDDVGDAEAPTEPKKLKTSALMDLLHDGPGYKTAAPASKKTVTEMAKE